MNLPVSMRVFDLNFSGSYSHACPASGEGVAHESWPDGVCAVDGFHSRARVSPLRRALPGQLQGHQFFLLGPIPVHGLCPTYLSREPARYRNLPARLGAAALPCGHSRTDGTQHPGRCQRAARLAHLCRSGSSSDRHRAAVVHQRKFWRGVATDRLRAGLHHHRSLSCAVPLGALSSPERGREDAYAARFAWQSSGLYPRGTGENPRDSHSRSVVDRTGFHLHHGPSLLGFPTAACSAPGLGLLHHSRPQRLLLPPPGFASHRQEQRPALRSNHSPAKFLSCQVLSRPAAPHSLPRCADREEPGFPDQQFSAAHPDHRATLQVPLASRVVFQVDQTTSAHQEVLRPLAQRGEDPNLDRHLRVRAAGDCSQAPGIGTQPLSHGTNSEPQFVRKSAPFTGFFAISLSNRNRALLQPNGSIQLMTGQLWRLATGNCFSESFSGSHTGCGDRAHNIPVLNFTDTAPGLGAARAQVTLRCDEVGEAKKPHPSKRSLSGAPSEVSTRRAVGGPPPSLTRLRERYGRLR